MGDTKNKVDTNQIRFENGLKKFVTDICFHKDQVKFGSFNYLTSFINSNCMLIYENRPSKKNFFGAKEIFFMNVGFKNGCRNEFKNNNEKSCSRSRNRFPQRIDLKAVWPRNGHAVSVAVKNFQEYYF